MIFGIEEDKEGFLWIATKDGLNRYDGIQFHIYRNDPEDSTSIAENYVRSILLDSRGILWIGTNSSGLDMYDPSRGSFVHVEDHLHDTWEEQIKAVNSLMEDAFGNIITFSPEGHSAKVVVPHFDVNRNQLLYCEILSPEEAYPVIRTLPAPFDAKNILGATIDGLLWYNTEDSLYAIVDKGNNITAVVHMAANHVTRQGMNQPAPNYFFAQAHTQLFAADHTNQIFRYNHTSGGFDPVITIPKEYRLTEHLLFLDHKNRIWALQLDRNMFRIDINAKTITRIFNKYSLHTGVKAHSFKLTCEDNQHNLWGRTSGHGLVKISSRNDLFHSIPSSEVNDYGIRAHYLDKSAGHYYGKDPFSTCEKLLEKGHYKPIRPDAPYNIAIDRNGNRWTPAWNIALKTGYLLKFNSTGCEYEIKLRVAIDSIDRFGVPVFCDRNDEIWFGERFSGDSVHLYHFDQQANRLDQFPFPVQVLKTGHHFISDYYITPENLFWLGTKQGLFLFNPQTFSWKHYSFERNNAESLSHNSILSILPDPREPDKYLWIGTDGGGLNKFNINTGKCIRFTTRDGLPNNVIYGILNDHKENLWMSTNYGLCFFNTTTFETYNFTTTDGLPRNEFNRYTYSKDTNGIMYYAGVEGAICLDPLEFYKSQESSPVVINQLKLSNKNVVYSSKLNTHTLNAYQLPKPLGQCKSLVFPYTERMITLGFTLLDFTNPEENVFKYRLEGFSDQWIFVNGQQEATFTNLKPGDYTFMVTGRNSANVWSESPATMMITILPPWWKTWWFRGFALFVFVYILYAFYRYRLRQAMKLQVLRNRIAADLHDEIGSTLSSVSLASSVIQQKLDNNNTEVKSLLQRINDNTNSMMEAMNDIVWAINTKNDRMESIIYRMRAFALEILEPEQVEVHFSISEQANQLQLDMQQRKNIYLIFKEAVNNAAKYAECRNLWVDIHYNQNKMKMRVQDDGIGFTLTQGENGLNANNTFDNNYRLYGGNGLPNIQKRTEEIKGKSRIESAKGKGTHIEVIFTV